VSTITAPPALPLCRPKGAVVATLLVWAPTGSHASVAPIGVRQQRRLGAITKTGSAHARRLLVEAAWHYRPRPNLGRRSASARPINPPQLSRSPGPRRSACTAPGPASKPAASAAPSSRSRPPANSPAAAGRSPKSSEPPGPSTPPSSRRPVGGGPARAGNPRPLYEHPAPTGWPRSTLDSGSPRRTMVLRPPGSAYISLTRVAHSSRTATHPADHNPTVPDQRKAGNS
jgi:hypothetical protein